MYFFLYRPSLDLPAKHLIFSDKAKTVGYGPVLKAVRIKGGFDTGQFTDTKKIGRTDRYGMVLTSLTYVHRLITIIMYNIILADENFQNIYVSYYGSVARCTTT